jgi:hypothetical protein
LPEGRLNTPQQPAPRPAIATRRRCAGTGPGTTALLAIGGIISTIALAGALAVLGALAVVLVIIVILGRAVGR